MRQSVSVSVGQSVSVSACQCVSVSVCQRVSVSESVDILTWLGSVEIV